MSVSFKGDVVCGFPSPGEENREEPLDFNQLLIRHKCTTFCLRAYGMSMFPTIKPNDILVVDRALGTRNNDIVVAEINGDFTVKTLKKTKNGIFLVPENPEFSEIAVTPETQIFGVVTSVIRQVRT